MFLFRILLLTALALSVPVSAQENVDAEMQRLMAHVASLRQTDRQQQKAAWNEVKTAFAGDLSWTIMDEIKPDVDGECSMTDLTVSRFSLNRILSQRVGHESTRVRGDFNNGEDPNFNYSLIERSVKVGKTVSYELKSREGQQLFVVMPFDTENCRLEVKVECNERRWIEKGRKGTDGNIYIMVPASRAVTAQDILTIIITNKGRKNMSFVLLNHNTRNK